MNDLAQQVFDQATMLQKRYMDGFRAGQASRELDVEKVENIIQLRYFKLMYPDITESDAEIVARTLAQAIIKADIWRVK